MCKFVQLIISNIKEAGNVYASMTTGQHKIFISDFNANL